MDFLGSYCIGLVVGAFVSWLWSRTYYTRRNTHIQIGGDNSSQVQIANINSDKPTNDKCRSCIYLRFIETNIGMKELHCYKHSCRCEEIKDCSDYLKIGHFLI